MRIGWPVGPAGCMILLTKKNELCLCQLSPLNLAIDWSSQQKPPPSPSQILSPPHTMMHAMGHGRRVKKPQKKKEKRREYALPLSCLFCQSALVLEKLT
jgi:hypothetical protein